MNQNDYEYAVMGKDEDQMRYISYTCYDHEYGFSPFTYTYKLNYHVTTITEFILHFVLICVFIYLQISLTRNLCHHIKNIVSKHGKGQTFFTKITFFLYLRGILEILGYAYQLIGFIFDYPIDLNYQLRRGEQSRGVYLQTYIAYFLNFLPIIFLQFILCIIAEENINFKKNESDTWFQIINQHNIMSYLNYILFALTIIMLIITTCLHNCQETIDIFQLLMVIYILFSGFRYTYCSNYVVKKNQKELLEHNLENLIKWIQHIIVISSLIRIAFQLTRFLTSPNFLKTSLCDDNNNQCQDLIKNIKLRNPKQQDDHIYWGVLQFFYYFICDIAPQYFLMKFHQPNK